jgi:hypothetical protein
LVFRTGGLTLGQFGLTIDGGGQVQLLGAISGNAVAPLRKTGDGTARRGIRFR